MHDNDDEIDDRELPDPSDTQADDNDDSVDGDECSRCGAMIYMDAARCPKCNAWVTDQGRAHNKPWVIVMAVAALSAILYFWFLRGLL